MTLSENMIDRWAQRHDPAPGERTLYWHVLMADQPEVVDLARQAADRLAPFSGLHLTPTGRLHMTTLVAGSAGDVSDGQLQQMVQSAASASTEPSRFPRASATSSTTLRPSRSRPHQQNRSRRSAQLQ
jgi:hypothetical protein